ncbi:MAG: FMN-binding protein [Peptococcaceae bacterium]|nr:FMN-binding protein [Peptococcaceae bacterium]
MSGHSDDSSNSIVKIALNLTVACLVSGMIISIVYFFTAEAAIEKAIELRNEAMRELVADADDFEAMENNANAFYAKKNGVTIAYIIPSDNPGYEGVMQVLTAVSTDGKVIDYKVTAHKETPGLGDKIDREPFKGQLFGKKKEELIVTKDPSRTDQIVSLTGATISSVAVTEAVKKALAEAESLMGGN